MRCSLLALGILAGIGAACAPAPEGDPILRTGVPIDAARADSIIRAAQAARPPGATGPAAATDLAFEDPFPDPDPPWVFEPPLTGVGEGPDYGAADDILVGSNLLEYPFGYARTAFYWNHWQSESEIQEIIDQGYRVYDVEIVQHAPSLRFQVLYVKNEGPYERDSLWKHDTTSTVLVHLVDNEDFRVTKLKPRQVGTALRFSAVLEKNTGNNRKGWRWWWDGSWDGIIDDFVENDHRPIDMEAYQFDGQTRWAGVGIENVGADERVWVPVQGLESKTVESLAKAVINARFTDLDMTAGEFYGILTVGSVEQGLNHWTHAEVPQSKILHLIRRHAGRIISIQRTSVVPGDDGLEHGYHLTLVDNRTPITGNAYVGFTDIDEAMVTSLKLGSIPGGALAIARNGRLVYARGYGFANLEANELATAETMFRLGSISKTMTAMSAMKLVDDGVPTPTGEPLTLETRVFPAVIWPALEGSDNIVPHLSFPHLFDVTLRHLLTHTGGWYEQHATYGLDVTPFSPTLPLNNTVEIARDLGIEHTPDCREIVPYYYGEPLDSAPGANVFYSGLGICAAALVVEILADKHYGDYFTDEFANHLKLNQGQKRFGYSSDHLSNRHPTEARYYHHFGADRISPLLIEMAGHFAEDGTPVFTDQVDAPYGGMPMRSIWSAGSWAASPIAMVRLATALQRTRRPYGPLRFDTFSSFFDTFEASQNGSWGGGGFVTNGSNRIEHGGALYGGFGYFIVQNENYAASPNLAMAFFFNASHTDDTYWPSINRVKNAVYDALGAINSANWDLFDQYGFVEPPPSLPVPQAGFGQLAVDDDTGLPEGPG